MSDCEIIIINEGIAYLPIVKGSVVWETARVGTPGKLTFSVINDNKPGEMKLNIQEGNNVQFRWNGQEVFSGFIFSKSRNKDQVISITAYDQLRYLKNKITFDYENKTTTELLKMLAKDFMLTVGECDDTSLPVSRRESNATILDIILNSLDETIIATKKMYVLYDNFGKLILQDIEKMHIDAFITENTAGDFDYQTSIDGTTYNRIMLFYDNKETGERKFFEEKDESNIQKWGMLMLHQSTDNPTIAQELALGNLKLYNSKRRALSIKEAFGDIRARAGASVPVSLKLGDVDANSFLIIEEAKHNFEDGFYTMDLKLRGDVFV